MNLTAKILIVCFLLLSGISCGKNEGGDKNESKTDFRKMPLEEVKALVDEGDLAAMT